MGAQNWRAESGVSLIELMVGISMSLVVLAGGLVTLELATRQQPRINERGDRIQESRAVLERITRELRQTYAVNASSSSSLDVYTYKGTGDSSAAQQTRVVFDCSGGSCTRQQGDVSGGALDSADELIEGVTNADIFTYTPDNVNPEYVQVKFTFEIKREASDPTDDVTVSDGVQLRNAAVPD